MGSVKEDGAINLSKEIGKSHDNSTSPLATTNGTMEHNTQVSPSLVWYQPMVVVSPSQTVTTNGTVEHKTQVSPSLVWKQPMVEGTTLLM